MSPTSNRRSVKESLEPQTLLTAVDRHFEATAKGLRRWPDPRDTRGEPADNDYSRVTDPDKWRIVGARSTAWAQALVEYDIADLEQGTSVRWADRDPNGTTTDRLIPKKAGAIPIVLERSTIADVDSGLTIGAGDPAVLAALVPDCGCDACDSGSELELEHLDSVLWDLLCGRFRHLTNDGRRIRVLGDGMSQTHTKYRFGRNWEVNTDKVLANPEGWDETSGAAWFETTTR